MGSSAHPPIPAMDDEEADYTYAAQLVCAAALPMTLKAAIELGLLDLIVSAGPGAQLSADDLAGLIRAPNPDSAAMIDRILRLLASHSILTCTTSTSTSTTTGTCTGTSTSTKGVRRYAAAPVCKYFTPNQEGVSGTALLLMCHDKVFMESWYYLKETVLNGGAPFNRAHGGLTEFEYQKTDPRFSKVFNEGMRSHSVITMKMILEKYSGFDGVRILVDVGGGVGGALSMITAAHPHIRGINFDLPHVIAQAPPIPGVEHISGDMFCSIPTGDAIFMKWILHDWNDEACVKILKNCWNALPEHGKVIILELNIPENFEASPSSRIVCLSDIVMMVDTPSGKERTKKEFEDLAMNSGFTEFKAILGFLGTWIMEFTK